MLFGKVTHKYVCSPHIVSTISNSNLQKRIYGFNFFKFTGNSLMTKVIRFTSKLQDSPLSEVPILPMAMSIRFFAHHNPISFNQIYIVFLHLSRVVTFFQKTYVLLRLTDTSRLIMIITAAPSAFFCQE